jgi:NAD-dependent SIR2 family protein deacetylase
MAIVSHHYSLLIIHYSQFMIHLFWQNGNLLFSPAGISASGLKTFRDSDGLWEGYNIEDVATPRAWRRDHCLDFYNVRVAAASPNAAHAGLAELEKF